MHVLILPSEQFVPTDSPGAGIFQYHQAVSLDKKGIQVGSLSVKQTFTIPMVLKAIVFRVVNKNVGNASDNHSLSELLSILYSKMFNLSQYISNRKVGSINVVDIDGFYYMPPSERSDAFGWVLAAKEAFRYYISKFGKPDIIHAHNSLYGGIAASDIYKEYNIPYIITEHSSRWARGEISSSALQRSANTAYRNSLANFAVSSVFSSSLNKLFPKVNFQVLPNVIDPILEEKVQPSTSHSEGTFTYLHIAEFKPVKDQRSLLKAFKELISYNKNVHLRIGGSGELEEQLKGLCKELDLNDYVTFLGYLNRDEVVSELSACDGLVMCSLYETFGVVLIEAMLAGKPVIASSSGGAVDIVTDRTGILVPPQDKTALCNAMLQLHDQYDKYNSEEIHNYVIDKFGSASFAQKLIAIYEEILKNDK